MHLIENPIMVFVLSFVVLTVSALAGAALSRRFRSLMPDDGQDLNLVVTATLTLLGLILGFSLSMAVSRYDQRINYEEAEANAVGTEYLRADLLPVADGQKLREVLRRYLNERILFYETRDVGQLSQINARTSSLQLELWSTVRAAAARQSDPVMALVISGANDVINSQGYSQAAWWNRLPAAVWIMMLEIAVFSIFLFAFDCHRPSYLLLLILPIAISLSFFLISDIDSPRTGLIRVIPQNLVSLSASLKSE